MWTSQSENPTFGPHIVSARMLEQFIFLGGMMKIENHHY
jgi:hypothetical protein